MKIVESSSSAWGRSGVRRLSAILGLLVVLMSASCGSLPKTAFYTLPLPPAPQAGDPKTNFSLGVEHFRAVEILRDDRIVYYKSPTEVNFYQYHRWSSDPATLLTEGTARRLSQMGLFAQLKMLPSREATDYTLKGRLLDFEEMDYGGQGRGRVALELTLVRGRDRRVIWSFTRQAERAIEEPGVAGVVSALSASSEDVLRQALPALAEQVEREFAETRPHHP